MKSGYTIENNMLKDQSIILVCNYKYSNNIVNQGFCSDKIIREIEFYSSIGMWKIKQLKTK